jgi:hypothetical protein
MTVRGWRADSFAHGTMRFVRDTMRTVSEVRFPNEPPGYQAARDALTQAEAELTAGGSPSSIVICRVRGTGHSFHGTVRDPPDTIKCASDLQIC